MSRDMNISEMGLKLIKAYEGYRPVDRELVTGQRVVGYGHRLYADDAVHMSKDDAEAQLRRDLEPFEDMINENVHAPLSQGQFDALCSLAFNIGPKAFLKSDTVRAINNGRILDAASSFDVWRKCEIQGKTYVVDALLRRRTAEKSLFLRTDSGRAFPASRIDLPPVEDQALALISTEDALPLFTENDANGIVGSAPYSTALSPLNPTRRREDGPAGGLSYSETPWDSDEGDDNTLDLDLADAIEESAPEGDDIASDTATQRASTLIAKAASELNEKLDSLIDDAGRETDDVDNIWPEKLITADTPDVEPPSTVVPFNRRRTEDHVVDMAESELSETDEFRSVLDATPPLSLSEREPDLIIDDLAADDAMREGANSAAKYIEISEPELPNDGAAGLTYWMTLLSGFALLGASLMALYKGVEGWLNGWGPLLTFAGVIVGGMLILAAIYYAIRSGLSGR
ncbi:lysozyme [Litorimonas sp. RW-G-Af-16]|uniref:lysozyme n=1 Tax=Litorimonas sp. RW-G-Af-16 TaxID=3241168 RepID=UPI00390CA603